MNQLGHETWKASQNSEEEQQDDDWDRDADQPE